MWDFFTTVLLVVKIFWFSRLIFEIVSLLSISHGFQNPQNFEKTLLWFISISFSLLTCLYTIWYFIQFSRYILRATSCDSWWRIRGSNPWPPACKAGALPAELIPHMLVFLRTYCVTARSLRYSHTSVCSVPQNSRALYLRKNPAHFVCSPLHKTGILTHFCFFKTVIVQKLKSP